MVVRPRHGDEELGLGVDLSRVLLLRQREEGDEEQECGHLQDLEQDGA
jgi:hypothetical protein